MDASFLESLVKRDGTLDSERIHSREMLYEGRNGKHIERFTVLTVEGLRSFIYKPLTNVETLGREPWIYRHLLPDVSIRYPQLLANSGGVDAEVYWSIYEDLGKLDHHLDDESLKLAIEAVPAWQQLPAERIPPDYQGHTPYIGDIIPIVTSQFERISQMLSALLLPASQPTSHIHKLGHLLHRKGAIFPEERVVSHGDYYVGNLAIQGNQLIVIDWEYVHLNSEFWDVFNLLDMTSPRYRRTPLRHELRRELLRAYMDKRTVLGWEYSGGSYEQDYYLYAAIFLVWILMLIDQDLVSGLYDRPSLVAQQQESVHILQDCLSSL